MSNGSADKDDPLSEAAEEPAEEESLPTISSLDELTQLSSPIELTVESRAHGWRWTII